MKNCCFNSKPKLKQATTYLGKFSFNHVSFVNGKDNYSVQGTVKPI